MHKFGAGASASVTSFGDGAFAVVRKNPFSRAITRLFMSSISACAVLLYSAQADMVACRSEELQAPAPDFDVEVAVVVTPASIPESFANIPSSARRMLAAAASATDSETSLTTLLVALCSS